MNTKIIIGGVAVLLLVLVIFLTAKPRVPAPTPVQQPVEEPAAVTEANKAKEKESVDTYLRANISALSPTKAVLGGTWYVVSDTVDPDTNTGTVVYEDGHIQEKKNFTYTTTDSGLVTSLTLTN